MVTLPNLPEQSVEYLLCRFLRAAGEVRGRIRMQKAVYLLGARRRPLFGDFFFHLRGPYSPALSNTLALLAKEGLVAETAEQLSADPDVVQYRYQLSDIGRRAVEQFETQPAASELLELGDEYEPVFVRLVKHTVRELELAASMLYWLLNGYNADDALKITADLKACAPDSPDFVSAVDLARKAIVGEAV